MVRLVTVAVDRSTVGADEALVPSAADAAGGRTPGPDRDERAAADEHRAQDAGPEEPSAASRGHLHAAVDGGAGAAVAAARTAAGTAVELRPGVTQDRLAGLLGRLERPSTTGRCRPVRRSGSGRRRR